MRVIDHAERRRKIAEVAIDVIAREGLNAATLRRIAADAGFSTMAVTHFFADKQALLNWTYKSLAQQGDDRFEEMFCQDPIDIVGVLLTMTAHDAGTRRRWRAYLAFWDQAARDQAFAAEYRCATETGLAQIDRVIRARNGEVPGAAEICQQLNAMIQGISLQSVVDENNWPVAKVRNLLNAMLNDLLGPPHASARVLR